MSDFFPENIIDEIRAKADIAQVIAQYIPLKQAGRNFRALCPFHSEKTPSFTVSPDKGIFHCFGCGAGGNVFTFVMKHEGLSFPQVVRLLAEKTGVKLPRTSKFWRDQRESNDLYQLNEIAADWYHDNLKKKANQFILEYLKKRSLDAATVIKFKMGFAGADNGLLNFMQSRGKAKELLEKAGLVVRKDNGRYYDRFRQRVVFPIFDSRGRILGFGGRVLDNSLPKYLNSPESSIYSKRNHLYGLNFAKEDIKKEDLCVIVEGYMDLLALYQNGFRNAVASLGTALTTEQIRLLKRFSSRVVIIFDGDQAGELASLRSLDLLIEEEVDVRIVALPKGEDPDSFLGKQGRDSFQQKISQGLDLFDYKLKMLLQHYSLESTEGKVKIAGQMLPTIRRVQNAIRRSSYVKRLAQQFSLGEKSLGEEWILAELKKTKRDFTNYSRESFKPVQVFRVPPAEELLLKIILKEEDAVGEAKKHLALEDFQDMRVKEIIQLVYRLHDQGKRLAADKLITCLEGEDKAALISRLLSVEELVDCRKSLNDCIKRIKMDNLKNRLSKITQEIKRAQSWGRGERIPELVKKYNSLIKCQDMGKWIKKQKYAEAEKVK